VRVPTSTYRLQITEEFDLLAAAATLPYLHDLGVDWVYLSPLLAAEADSEHGYDVADHNRIDPARGGAAGLSALSAEARRLGMGVLVDIVPNHVGVADPAANTWWWHVLQHGQQSAYASAFDIDWAAGGGRLRLPVVGDDDQPAPGDPIAHLRVEAGQLRYHDHAFPLAPGTLDDVPLGEDGEPDPQVVHARQHYELVNWRQADAGLNYRRFFAINSLAAVRVEDPEWFERTHAAVRGWFDDGEVDGLRIDHPDGLRDPVGYLDDLAELTGGAYVLVEKILEPGEQLPTSWATAGTTGYDALAWIDRVLTDPAGEQPLTALEDELRGAPVDWHQMVHDNKRVVADTILRAEVLRIGRELRAVPAIAGPTGEPPANVDDAVAELLAAFPVYRSYLPGGLDHLEHAFTTARESRPDLATTLDVLHPVLSDPEQPAALRFQQTSGMVMAKGVEDCSFYRWSRLTSLNEVGGDPSVFSLSPDDFHAAMAARQADWPDAMTCLTTHDTKRGEDVRARITALAEVPESWRETLSSLLAASPLPEPGFGNLLHQAVVGAWSDDPALGERLHAYAEKAMREAGDHTTWTAVDADYESRVHEAVDSALASASVPLLVSSLERAGWTNGLAAKLLSITIPGVPDVYQGSELWEDSLVDPDNRRSVDFDARTAALAELDSVPALAADGLAKLLVTHRALMARRDDAERFTSYTPVFADGPAADHALAFDRGGAITVVTRLPLTLQRRGGWADTTLPVPSGRWRDVMTGREIEGGDVSLAELLADLPVALLVRADTDDAPVARGRFDVWAPRAQQVTLALSDPAAASATGAITQLVEMRRDADDWWRPTGDTPAGEVDYGYRVDGADRALPDPRSRRQPHGVHGLSRTFDADAFDWTDQGWTGRQLAGSVVYELHVGTFTPEGTLDAAIERLDHLVDLGIDLVEVMPVNAFNGEHGWGYDGVAWFAVHEAYGGPSAYQRFVDACHARGLGVVQDVVFNHLGPSGNYLPVFGPYLTSGSTTWGDEVNLDQAGSAEVRRLILDSARMWCQDFHVDGLRLDAVHALVDESGTHLLTELATEIDALSAHLRRPITLIAESDLNDPAMITPREAGGMGMTGQWSDDFHHAVHVALTGEIDGYYADFAPLSALAKVLERGFFHDGTWSSFRGRPHGSPIDPATVPAWRLVVATQNHDQVGNRARGDRLTGSLDEDQLGCAAMLLLASPFTPMLFQGEEWGATTPFQFFTSHPEEDLGRAVSEGRLREFEKMAWDTGVVPDPQDPATFQRSKLDWTERESSLLALHRDLIRLRRDVPELSDPRFASTSVEIDEERRTVLIRRGTGADVAIVALNLGEGEALLPVPTSYDVRLTTASGASVVDGAVVLPPHAGAVLTP